MNGESSKPFKLAYLLLYWTGVWSPESSNKFHIIRRISQIILFAFLSSMIYAIPEGLVSGNLTVMATYISIGTISLLGGYDVIVLAYSERFQRFMTNVIENEKFLNNNSNESLRKVHQEGVKRFWPTFLFQVNFVVISVVMLWFVRSSIMHTLDKLEHEEECRAAQDCSMVLIETWYCPFNVDIHYWWANVMQLSFAGICVLLNFERDLCFSSFICYIRCRLRVLAYVLQKSHEFVEKNMNEVGYFEEVDELLRFCVREHQNIISEFQELKSMISSLLFLMVTLNVPIVLFGVLLIFKSEQWLQFLAVFIYSCSYALSHLFMILRQADNLSSESIQVADEIYNSYWYTLRIDQQRVLLIMMTRAQKPFVLNCGFLCFATVNTFVKTIKTIYSFLNAVIKLAN